MRQHLSTNIEKEMLMGDIRLSPKHIITNYWAKPIPPRQFDWEAWRDGDEPNDDGQMLCGYGRTKQEAIDDLMDRLEELA
jgi:hypothetical protein